MPIFNLLHTTFEIISQRRHFFLNTVELISSDLKCSIVFDIRLYS